MPAPVSALLVVATVLALAAPGEGAPAAAGAPAPIVLNFHHPEIVLGEPEMVESYGLTVRLPEGWVVEEDGDGIRFTAPGGVDGAGIALVVS
ncbi:MAG TPA: hypothetical protein VEI97_00885, partial [bacterium]|nr:hypothetical protein [bacterium]